MDKKHRRKRKRKRKREATKFGRELRLTATRSARRIIADRSHSTLISAREGKRSLPLCASGTRERRFRGNATTDNFRGLNARRGFSQCPNSTVTLNRPLLVINNFCAQEREQKRELQSTNIHCNQRSHQRIVRFVQTLFHYRVVHFRSYFSPRSILTIPRQTPTRRVDDT